MGIGIVGSLGRKRKTSLSSLIQIFITSEWLSAKVLMGLEIFISWLSLFSVQLLKVRIFFSRHFSVFFFFIIFYILVLFTSLPNKDFMCLWYLRYINSQPLEVIEYYQKNHFWSLCGGHNYYAFFLNYT